jgi:hypothetical protein
LGEIEMRESDAGARVLPMIAHAKSFAAQSLVAFVTFTAIGTLAAFLAFGAYILWEGWQVAVITAGFAAGVSGACCWPVAYSKEWCPTLHRSIFVGTLAGILCPCFYFIVAIVGGTFGLIEGVSLERFSFPEAGEVVIFALFGLVLFGAATVPAGILAAMATRYAVTQLGSKMIKSALEP